MADALPERLSGDDTDAVLAEIGAPPLAPGETLKDAVRAQARRVVERDELDALVKAPFALAQRLEQERVSAAPEPRRWPSARPMVDLCANTAAIVWAMAYVAIVGCLTLLVAREKSGKTTLILAALKAHLVDGGWWLATATKRVVAVLVTEEGDQTIKAAAARLGLLQCADIYIISARSLPGATWPEIVAHAYAEVDRLGATFLAFDTIPGIAGLPEKGENDSGVAIATMRPVNEGLQARPHLAVVATMHANKAAGRGISRPTDMLRGSTGWAGECDLLVGLNLHPRDARTRVLTFEGRVDTPARVDLTLSPDGVYELADSDANEPENEPDALWAVPVDGHGITPADFMRDAGVSRAKAQRLLSEGYTSGRLRRTGAGTGRASYRYTRIEVVDGP